MNNAGIHDDAVFPGMRADQWHRVIDVSLNGFFNVTQPLMMPMIRSRWGRIINLSSVASLMGNHGQVNYAAAKGALNAATKSLAREVASRGITVNAVAPGIIHTAMSDGSFRCRANCRAGANETRRHTCGSRRPDRVSRVPARGLYHRADHLHQRRTRLNPDARPGDVAPVRAPHQPLTGYYATEQERQAYLRRIFDNTAADYDRIERLLALGSGSYYRRQALLRGGLIRGMKVLDVGVGTGLVALQACALAGDAALVTGVDPSCGMMAAGKLPSQVTLVEGRAEHLPFPDNQFDFLSMGYALRHISDLGVAFAEFYRVLKPGGRLCLLEITQAQSRAGRWLLKSYMRGVIPLLTRVVSRHRDTATIWRYYWDSIEACVRPEQVMATLRASGLAQVRRHLELGIFSEFQACKLAPATS